MFAKACGIKVLSEDQRAKDSREGSFDVTQGYLTRFAKIDAMFTINDLQAISMDLAALDSSSVRLTVRQTSKWRSNRIGQLPRASQDPYAMARQAVDLAYAMMNRKKPANPWS